MTDEEVLWLTDKNKFGRYKRISLHCPRCSFFGLMPIQAKGKIKRKVSYVVKCPSCGHIFIQIGRPWNFWREVKKRYKIDSQQLRAMKREMMKNLLRTEDPGIFENEKVLKIGSLIAIKPKDKDKDKRR